MESEAYLELSRTSTIKLFGRRAPSSGSKYASANNGKYWRSQPTFTYSKSTIETIEKGVKYVQSSQ